MLFSVLQSAMDGSEVVLDALDGVLARAEEEVHELEMVRADTLEESSWYQSSRPDRRKLLEEIAKTTLNRVPRVRGPHLRRVEVSDAASAARARQIAQTPLRVLTENDVSDGALVVAALKAFGSTKTQELCFGRPSRLAPPALQIESRGGHGELKKLLARYVADSATSGRPPRLVVVADSDGEWPGDIKEHAQTIRSECANASVPCPPLNKRTAENYIPDDAWRVWVADISRTNMRPAIEALLRLSADQRDYVNMAATGTDPWDLSKPDANSLFQTPQVASADAALLKDAHLKGKRDHMVILALNNYSDALFAADLRRRDQNGDLLALVQSIEDEL